MDVVLSNLTQIHLKRQLSISDARRVCPKYSVHTLTVIPRGQMHSRHVVSTLSVSLSNYTASSSPPFSACLCLTHTHTHTATLWGVFHVRP